MLVSQFQEVRRFMGRLDAGQDIAAGLKSVCRENSVASAWIQAAAVLKNAVVARLREDGSGLGEPGVVEGSVFCPAISGNVSLDGESMDVRLYAVCYGHDGEASPRAVGVLRGGEVLSCEFYLTACDDTTLVRQGADPRGYAPWMELQPGGTMHPRVTPTRPPDGPLSRPTPPPPTVMDEDESSELNMLDMATGDYVDHPRFGVCRIVHAPQDEKVTIRLPAGKHVDLHLGVMRVLQSKQLGGRKVFQVEVRRKG